MNHHRTINSSLVLAAALVLSPFAFGQTAVTTTIGGGSSTVATTGSTTTSIGTISEFSPDTIVIRSETAPEPVRYTYTKTTTYVDETGAPVSMELVKSGLPVTVHYVKEGDRMIASRVIVRRSKTTTTDAPAAVRSTTIDAPTAVRTTTRTEAPAPVVEEKKTTTTTTTTGK